MKLHSKQREVVLSPKRFKIVRAGRKAGKSALEIETLCYKAMVSASKLGLSKTKFATGRKVIYVAPTQDQARRIVWEALKTRLANIGTSNEQQLIMKVPNEDGETTTIYVGGYENRENYRGLTDVVHITFDELDTLKDFFVAWREIFRPLFLDTRGTADFIGTPKKESGNLRRLEKESVNAVDWACFHFTSRDNPHIPSDEIDAMEKEYENDRTTYRQEVLAEYVENAGALFKYSALQDMFTNVLQQNAARYMTVDIADDGQDCTVFAMWDGLTCFDIETHNHSTTEMVIATIRELAAKHRIPYSNIAVDAIGVGAGVATSSLLSGVVGFKSSFAPIKTDIDPTRLPSVHYTKEASLSSEYKNLRSQCVFTLSKYINNHEIACTVKDSRIQEMLIEELFAYQDASKGDGKIMALQKDEVKQIIGRSPDLSDTFIERCYFILRDKMLPNQGEDAARLLEQMEWQFRKNQDNQSYNNAR